MTAAPAKPLLIRDALLEARRLLHSDESALDAELLLMHALGVHRARLYHRLPEPLAPEAGEAYRRLLDRRLAGEPVPYITGHREFFALDFKTTRAALIPRPETERLVELAIAFAHERHAGRSIAIADIGTGSGVIAVALARELPLARIVATDVSAAAIALARRNAARHDVAGRIHFREGDLLEPLTEPAQIIAANLPYVTTAQWESSPPEIHDHEPRVALDGGPDGLDLIRRLLAQAASRLAESGALFCEIGAWQGDEARYIARRAFPDARIEIGCDLSGRDRVLCVYS
ncbi:MAG: peptide chain release factor N(5)-glutamine methyltransferase [Chloroflexota bacterium]|nr:peptide chain release factor N(5)-glutamine methyltransferase [Chloroflexota bacterium]